MYRNRRLKMKEKIEVDLEKVKEECQFFGNLVVFDKDNFFWNAYGKDSIDTENVLTREQWEDFVSSEDYLYLEMTDAHGQAFDQYCRDNKLGEYKDGS
jgi:hypothetical protein